MGLGLGLGLGLDDQLALLAELDCARDEHHGARVTEDVVGQAEEAHLSRVGVKSRDKVKVRV